MSSPNKSVQLNGQSAKGPPYQQSVEEAVTWLNSHVDLGLTQAEATERLAAYGPNQIETVRQAPWWQLLVRQFWSPLVGLLIVAAGLSFWYEEKSEGWAVLIVIFLNALIGFAMEWNARRTMEAYRKLSGHRASVIRAGEPQDIDARDLVPGDLISLETGALVPADARLLRHTNLSLREAILTGESTPANKTPEVLSGHLAPGDQKNMVFQGTIIVRGNGVALVTETGIRTQLGRIASLTEAKDNPEGPLDKKLARLGRRLIWLTLVIAGLIILLGIYQGNDPYEVVKTAIALAVAAIPEGLPIIATLTLAIGMVRLARQKMVVKTLDAVETLGQTQVLMIDKTGTLTENRMTVQGSVMGSPQADLDTSKGGDHVQLDPATALLLDVSVLCNNATLKEVNKQPLPVAMGNGMGDPLELALLAWATQRGVKVEDRRRIHPRLQEQPFSSTSGMMATLHRTAGATLVCLKGAPSVVLARCDQALLEDGKKGTLNREAWGSRADTLAGEGLKVLAFAFSEEVAAGHDFAQSLVFLGLIAFWDPPRPNIRKAIDACQEAGIRVVMATGDHPETARNIGLRTGLIEEANEPIVTGGDLARTQVQGNDISALPEASIYARVTPEQKLQLLTHFQQSGLVVGMAGDGANDAPAIRRADIGIAMGEGGTAAATEAADLILQDNSFATIVQAIRQGREIFTNIRLFVIYLLSCNLSEILIIGSSFVVDFVSPLLPLQILFLNMVTDVFPALALGLTKTEEDVLKQPPRTQEEGILTTIEWRSIAIYASVISLVVLGGGYLAREHWGYSLQAADNLVFYTLLSAQLWHVFSLPEARANPFKNGITRNKYVFVAIVTCLFLMAGAYLLPTTRTVLGLEILTDWNQAVLPIFLGMIPVLIIWLVKRIGWTGEYQREQTNLLG